MPKSSEISDPLRLSRTPKVSVVVITYNHEDCLAQAIDSIAAQKAGFPFEIIIAEDCSTDGTRAVAEDLQRRYPQLVRLIFTPENKGMNANLRFALEQVRAPLVAFCEGDDFWIDEGKLERQVAALEAAPGVDLAFTQGLLFEGEGRTASEPGWDYGPVARIVSARELFSGFRWVLPTASMLWRAEAVDPLPDWVEEAPFADMVLMIAASARGGGAYDPHVAVAYRRTHPSSFTVRLRDSASQARADYARKARETLRRACLHYRLPSAILQHRMDDYQLQLVRELARSGRWVAAARELLRIRPLFFVAAVRRRYAGPAGTKGTGD